MKSQPTKIQYAFEIFNPNTLDAHFGGGFNSRVQGSDRFSTTDGAYRNERGQGWDVADRMIQAGEIYFVHPFPHGNCKLSGFTYGGSWACNGCNTDGFQKPWWKVRTMKDGNAWVVMGEGFENLQSSSNYAYGDTRQGALDAYAELMNQKLAA
ncbi:hypothetical protein [Pseudomonas sp. CCI2.4]|uniref:hypothetical protein n=1 Tax=Pseudomonas sp. CCI2.4 TaxID=3048617 RepID=UPI002B22F12F|nr:hypothetical protein [Pseudomonas sp. CCI2.4]MEB0133445.1 hypothetical protein [Pseudomonas sp. CCI2.4]